MPSFPSAPRTVASGVRRAVRLSARLAALTSGPQQLAGPDPVEVVRTVGASSRIAVFVPSPGDGPAVWEQGREATGASYPERLRDLLGWSTVELRVAPTSVAAGSLALAAAVQRLVERWPVEPERIVLVGHSAGGLLARGASGLRYRTARVWTDLLSEVICLGTPTYAVRAQALAGSLGRMLDQQLAGIVTVEHRVLDVHPAPGVAYLVVSDAAISRSHAAGRLLGELLWWRHRAPRRPRETHDLFPTAQRYEVSSRSAPLGNHPGVHSMLLERLV